MATVSIAARSIVVPLLVALLTAPACSSSEEPGTSGQGGAAQAGGDAGHGTGNGGNAGGGGQAAGGSGGMDKYDSFTWY